jgi:hypothetical protein
MGETRGSDAGLDEIAREALAELEAYLEGWDPRELGELVLPLGSRWVLNDAGLDVERLRREAELLVRATPLSDRILLGFPDHVAYWISQRMMVDEHEVEQPDQAAARLQAARSALAQRAELVRDAGFPLVALGFDAVLDSDSGSATATATAATGPPDAPLWVAMAHRVGESVLDV